MSFTVVNVHLQSGITEGGILGLTLFLYKVLGIDPSFASTTLDFLCFAAGFSMFGKNFLKKTALASLSFAAFYKVFLWIGPILPNFYDIPIVAAIIGGIGIGIGCGMVITEGGAAGGDDAIALILSNKLKINISKAYFFTDLVVLLLSLVYIPFRRIFFSIMTTLVSSFLIGQFEVKIDSTKQRQSA